MLGHRVSVRVDMVSVSVAPSRSALKRPGSAVGMSAKSSRMLCEGFARRVGASYTTYKRLFSQLSGFLSIKLL